MDAILCDKPVPALPHQFFKHCTPSFLLYCFGSFCAHGFCGRNGGNGDTVQVLCPQLHAHKSVHIASCAAVVAVNMHTNQVGFALDGIVQAQLGEIAVGGVDVVQVDVLHRDGNDLVAGDVFCGKQEQSGITHEILNIGQAECGLRGDFLVAQIAVEVQNVGKADNLGNITIHAGKLVQHVALCQSKALLPSGSSYSQRASVQEGVEVAQNLVLQGDKERLVGLFNGNICAVLGDCLNGYALGILGNLNVAVGFGRDLHLGQRNLIALSNGRTASQSAVNSGLIGDQLRAGGLADGAHNAHDGAQRVPVLAKAGDKVNLPGIDSNLGSGSQVRFCSHILAPFLIVRFVLHEVHKRSLTLCGGQYIAALVVRLVDVLPRQGFSSVVCRGSRRVCAFGAALGDVLAIIGLEALFKCSSVFDSAFIVQFQLVQQAVSLCKACDRGNPFFRNADFQQDVGQCLFFGSRCFFSVYVGLVVPESLVLCFILSLVAAVALRFQVVQLLLNARQLFCIGFIPRDVVLQRVNNAQMERHQLIFNFVSAAFANNFTDFSACKFCHGGSLLFFGGGSSPFEFYLFKTAVLRCFCV
nr:MAG TPA: hypothetical protein [Caudoviricetes sp.]